MMYLRYALDAKKVYLNLNAIEHGDSNKCRLVALKQLNVSDMRSWNSKKQIFEGSTQDIVDNNNILKETMEMAQSILDSYNPKTPKEFADLYKRLSIAEPTKQQTLGEYLQAYIDYLCADSPSDNMEERKTSTYKTFLNLLRRLKTEGVIINKSIKDIDNRDFIAFANWIISDYGGVNYEQLCGKFKTIHQRAFNAEINDHLLRYKYKDYAPPRQKKTKHVTVSHAQFEEFVKLDLTRIKPNTKTSMWYKELYRDFLSLMYEASSRPIDVLLLHHDDIRVVNGKKCWPYVPAKKWKSRSKNKLAVKPLSKRALQIIEKYRGQSKLGFVLPTNVTKCTYNLGIQAEQDKLARRVQSFRIQAVNFIKKAAPYIGIDPDGFINYSFRRGSLTHDILKNDKPILQIAKEGGTSVEMLEQHYYDQMQGVG